MNWMQIYTLSALLFVISASSWASNLKLSSCQNDNYIPDIDVPNACIEKGLGEDVVLPIDDTMCESRRYATFPGNKFCVRKKPLSINLNSDGSRFLIGRRAVNSGSLHCQPSEQFWPRKKVCVGKDLAIDIVGRKWGLNRPRTTSIETLSYCPIGYTLPGDEDMNICMRNIILYRQNNDFDIHPDPKERCKNGYTRKNRHRNAWCTANKTLIYRKTRSLYFSENSEDPDSTVEILDGIQCADPCSSKVVSMPQPGNSSSSRRNTPQQFMEIPVLICPYQPYEKESPPIEFLCDYEKESPRIRF